MRQVSVCVKKKKKFGAKKYKVFHGITGVFSTEIINLLLGAMFFLLTALEKCLPRKYSNFLDSHHGLQRKSQSSALINIFSATKL